MTSSFARSVRGSGIFVEGAEAVLHFAFEEMVGQCYWSIPADDRPRRKMVWGLSAHS